jgi:hypothetical protein
MLVPTTLRCGHVHSRTDLMVHRGYGKKSSRSPAFVHPSLSPSRDDTSPFQGKTQSFFCTCSIELLKLECNVVIPAVSIVRMM